MGGKEISNFGKTVILFFFFLINCWNVVAICASSIFHIFFDFFLFEQFSNFFFPHPDGHNKTEGPGEMGSR